MWFYLAFTNQGKVLQIECLWVIYSIKWQVISAAIF